MKKSIEKKGDLFMYNRVWIFSLRLKARIKEALGIRLTAFEDFMIEIGLY